MFMLQLCICTSITAGGPVLSEDVKTHRKNDFSWLKRAIRHWECYTHPSIPNTVVTYTHKTVLFPAELTPSLRLSLLTCSTAVQLTSVLRPPANAAMSPALYRYTHLTEVSVQAQTCSIVIISGLMFLFYSRELYIPSFTRML